MIASLRILSLVTFLVLVVGVTYVKLQTWAEVRVEPSALDQTQMSILIDVSGGIVTGMIWALIPLAAARALELLERTNTNTSTLINALRRRQQQRSSAEDLAPHAPRPQYVWQDRGKLSEREVKNYYYDKNGQRQYRKGRSVEMKPGRTIESK